MTTVINIKTLTRGQMLRVLHSVLPGYIYIGRSTGSNNKWGNHYSHRKSKVDNTWLVESRSSAIEFHERDVLSNPELIRAIKKELKDKILVCWCKPLDCHGDTLARIADEYNT